MARRAQKTTTTLINGGTTPVIYTDDGRVLPAGQRVTIDSTEVDEAARALIERGYLGAEVSDSTADKTDDGDRDEDKRPGASDQESTS